jgi:hypothetical protein
MICWDLGTRRPLWSAAHVVPSAAVSFTASGEIIYADEEVIQKELVYYVEQPNGRVKLYNASEFKELVEGLAPVGSATPFDSSAKGRQPPRAIAPVTPEEARTGSSDQRN